MKLQTWKSLRHILILDAVSLAAYSPAGDQTICSAEPENLISHAKSVHIWYLPFPNTANCPLGLRFKLLEEI